ncbi:hypothetical protein KFZ58_12755 [Virgibacillus sp. NKC19-16]|uniref:hypothetical protein n=1 Tax=Virgibacillus salidurans TaxID=2831673 RepID=UPI001F37ED41|nr:hypothetical protein [Virgibacillus sp. NKC19-16]UJL45275.1 hypothetical protein KFZ58_12755 [Virgibacillus sp. NKC19-16]
MVGVELLLFISVYALFIGAPDAFISALHNLSSPIVRVSREQARGLLLFPDSGALSPGLTPFSPGFGALPPVSKPRSPDFDALSPVLNSFSPDFAPSSTGLQLHSPAPPTKTTKKETDHSASLMSLTINLLLQIIKCIHSSVFTHTS